MQGSNKHSTIKGLLITLRAWSVAALHGHYYGPRHRRSGRPDRYKAYDRGTIRRSGGDTATLSLEETHIDGLTETEKEADE